eukprot:m.98038 g.98038  ORF g.98038 m.98038 type:complete len:171 (+) comp36969_c0_seq27:1916-2428(+)
MNNWLDYVECTKLKAFVEVISASSVRAGSQYFMMASGLGGMRPNTVVLGFYDTSLPEDTTHNAVGFVWRKTRPLLKYCSEEDDTQFESVAAKFPHLRTSVDEQQLQPLEYVGIIKDSLQLDMNVCILRNFQNLDKSHLKHGTIGETPTNVKMHSKIAFAFAFAFRCVAIV